MLEASLTPDPLATPPLSKSPSTPGEPVPSSRPGRPKPQTIALDGPAGAGKSTIGQLLAQRLGYRFVDTGAMYRAFTWLTIQKGLDPTDEVALSALAAKASVEITQPTVSDGRAYSVLVEGKDITRELHSSQVEARVTLVSRVPGVQKAMIERQRLLAEAGKVVMAGRDSGTLVLPEAELKVYLLASVEERARRRYRELRGRAQQVEWADVRDGMVRRHKTDSDRATSRHRIAADAQIVDTDNLTIKEVLQEIERLMEPDVPPLESQHPGRPSP